jgi:hypothetical protein
LALGLSNRKITITFSPEGLDTHTDLDAIKASVLDSIVDLFKNSEDLTMAELGMFMNLSFIQYGLKPPFDISISDAEAGDDDDVEGGEDDDS